MNMSLTDVEIKKIFKMTFAMVSSMLLFLLLLLVFPHINNALGVPMDLEALRAGAKETNLPGQVPDKLSRLPFRRSSLSPSEVEERIHGLGDAAKEIAPQIIANVPISSNAAQDTSSNGFRFRFWCLILVISLFFKLY